MPGWSVKKTLFLAVTALLSSGLWAASSCGSPESKVIDSEARCIDKGGISISADDDAGAKVACLENKEVQGRCGLDGRVARLHAYAAWLNKLKTFEDQCTKEGGTFSYKDPAFIEPADESFCEQAVPEVGSTMFEESLCTFRSSCPSVTVLCERSSCAERTVASLP
jgi:hypothetical protein